MKVVFRVDSSFEIGMGHLMRCLTLASALEERGAICRFVCRDHAGASLELVRERGFELQVLPLDADRVDLSDSGMMYVGWVGGAVQDDAEATVRAAERHAPDWLVVDHYGLDASWELVLRRTGCRVLVIDDLADRSHACELLVDQTPGRIAEDYSPWLLQETELLLGGDYALLRPDFAQHRKAALERRAAGRIGHVLVSMGGSDPNGVTAQVLDALEAVPARFTFCVTAVMNSRSPALDAVRKCATNASRDTRVLCDVTDMASLMVDSDLAIGGAGTTSWERCCLGLPSLLVVLADNQKMVADQLEFAGAAEVIREFCNSDTGKGELVSGFRGLFGSPEIASGMANAAARLVDGMGAARVADVMRGAA